MKYFRELFYKVERHVPGGESYTIRAAEAAGISALSAGSRVLDAGCATGNASFVLLDNYPVHIDAVDVDEKSLKVFEEKAIERGLEDRVVLHHGSMMELPFEKETFDIIWAEGAIHNVGFFKGVSYLQKFLKPQGCMVISELTWIKKDPPDEVFWYWKENYPDMVGIEENLSHIKKAGLKEITQFVVGKEGFWDNYYRPMCQHMNYFSQKFVKDSEAQQQLEELQLEIDNFVKYGDYYSYVFYVCEK